MADSRVSEYGSTNEAIPGNNDGGDRESTPQDDRCRRGKHKLFNSAEGVLLSLFTGVAIAVANGCMTVGVIYGLSQFQVQIINGFTCFTILSVTIVVRRLHFLPESCKDRSSVIINGMLWSTTGILLLYSLSRAPFGNVSSIFIAGQSLFTPVMSILVLREMCRWVEALGTVLDVIGIILITHPAFVFQRSQGENTAEETLAYVMVTVAALTMVTTYIIGRFIGSRVHPLVTTIYLYVFLIIANVILMLTIDSPSWRDLGWIPYVASVGSGLFGGLGEFCRFRALQLESAISVVLLANTQMLMAYVFQIAIFHQGLHVFEVVGASLILLASIIVTLVTWKRNLKHVKQEEELELLN